MLNRPDLSGARRKRVWRAERSLARSGGDGRRRAGSDRDWRAKNWFGFIVLAVLASSLVAQRSLYDHVAAVAEALSSAKDSRAGVKKWR